MIIELLILLFILACLCFKLYQWRIEIISKYIPGRFSLPLLGNTEFVFVKSLEDFFVGLKKYCKPFRDVGITRIWFGPIFFIMTWEPKFIQAVAESASGGHKGYIYELLIGELVNGTVIKDGKDFRDIKKPLLKVMGRKHLNSYKSVMYYKSKDLVNYLKEGRCGVEFDIFLVIGSYIIDIFSETILGVKSNEGREQTFSMMENINKCVEIVTQCIVKYNVFFWKTITKVTGELKKFHHYRSNCFKFIDWIIEERKKIGPSKGVNEDELYSDFLIRMAKESNQSKLRRSLEFSEAVIAGSDTITVTSSTALLFLAMFPDIQDEAFKEQVAIFGDSQREPTLEDLESMEFLTRIIKETMRKASIMGLARSLCDDVQLGEYILPKNSVLYVFIHEVHNNPKYWQNPDGFYPDHFLVEQEAARPKYSYIPFGFGSRLCPGLQYGMMEIKIIISTILRNFVLSTSMRYEYIKYKFKLMAEIDGGYNVKFEERIK